MSRKLKKYQTVVFRRTMYSALQYDLVKLTKRQRKIQQTINSIPNEFKNRKVQTKRNRQEQTYRMTGKTAFVEKESKECKKDLLIINTKIDNNKQKIIELVLSKI